MAEAFRSAVRLNYAEPAFNAEVDALCKFIQGHTASKGDHILLTHTPSVGLHINLAGKAEIPRKELRAAMGAELPYSGHVLDLPKGVQNAVVKN